MCNPLYLFFGLFFLAATPYHVIPCNFLLLFYSSICSVYSWFFLINLMKTGIGQSKYCIPQPFSRCLISLCNSLFDFNSNNNNDDNNDQHHHYHYHHYYYYFHHWPPGFKRKKEAWLRRPARYLHIFFSVPGLKLQNGKAY